MVYWAPLGPVEGLPPHADEAGSRKMNHNNDPRTATEPKPLLGRDGIHEVDGGFGSVSGRQQGGRQILKDERMGGCFRRTASWKHGTT